MRREIVMSLIIFALTCLGAANAAVAAATAPEEINVRGRLARTVEAGGWLIVSETEKYLILNHRRFQNESWFREGTEVEAVGETKPGTITIYQEGIPFEVSSLRQRRQTDNRSATTAAEAGTPHFTRIAVTGDATVQAQPDTAIITIAVVTQNQSASEAQSENAARTEAVVRAVKTAAGAGAEVKTSGYALQPQYTYKQNESPTISGYVARNSVVVTMGDLTRVGAVIDAAVRAGANNIDNLSFTLRRDRPSRNQALTEATRAAVGKAQILAESLGGRVVRIIEVQEVGAGQPPVIPLQRESLAMAKAADVSTPIEVGALDIRSQVQLIAEVSTPQR